MSLRIGNPNAFFVLLFLIPVWIFNLVQDKRFQSLSGLFRFGVAIDNNKAITNLKKYRNKIKIRIVLWSIAWICFTLSLCDPYWGEKPIAEQKSGTAVCFVFDISNSMNANDVPVNYGGTRLKASSLYAKSLLEKLNGSIVSAVIAKGSGIVAIPGTDDFTSIDVFLENLSSSMLSAPGSSLGSGIKSAIISFPTHIARKSSIVLFTDGEETDENLKNTIIEALKYGISVVIVGFGSESGTTVLAGDGVTEVKSSLKKNDIKKILDSKEIKLLEYKDTSTCYVSAVEPGSAAKVLKYIKPTQNKNGMYTSYEKKPVSRYRFFALLAILFLILGFIASELNFTSRVSSISIIFLLLFFTSCSVKTECSTEILKSTFQWYQKDYTSAVAGFIKAIEKAENYNDKNLVQYGLYGLAASYYMENEGEIALHKLLEISPDAPDEVKFASLYTAGVISSGKGRYSEAVEFFKQALMIDSGNVEAKINYELSLKQSTVLNQVGNQEILPSGDSETKNTSAANTIFKIIRENDSNEWKNREQETEKSSALDY